MILGNFRGDGAVNTSPGTLFRKNFQRNVDKPVDTNLPLASFCPLAAMLSKLRQFFSEVSIELQKTTWPWDPKESGFKKFRELTDSTVVVLVAMLLLGAFVVTWDYIMLAIMRILTFGFN
jgi:preprotein translocase subunit SecE